jgi:hypothetical protein
VVTTSVVASVAQPSPTNTASPEPTTGAPISSGRAVTTPTPTPTPTTTTTTPASPGPGPEMHMSFLEAGGLALLIALTTVIIGMVILRARTGWLFKKGEPKPTNRDSPKRTDDDKSLVRPAGRGLAPMHEDRCRSTGRANRRVCQSCSASKAKEPPSLTAFVRRPSTHEERHPRRARPRSRQRGRLLNLAGRDRRSGAAIAGRRGVMQAPGNG